MCLLLLLKTVCLCTSCRHADDEQTVPSQIAMKSRASWVKISPSRSTVVRQEDGARQYDGGPGNPEALARGGFQVLQSLLRLVASGLICPSFLENRTGPFASDCVWLRLSAGLFAHDLPRFQSLLKVASLHIPLND